MGKVFGITLVLSAFFVSSIAYAAPKTENEKEALRAVTAWLSMVDAKAYGKSWTHSAALFRQAVSKDAWVGQVKAVRNPLGPVLSRKVIGTHYAKELPGAPDGEYVVIQYQTSFSQKKSAVETITPMRDPDGKWRVSGYYIK